jgi:hypothetical protein
MTEKSADFGSFRDPSGFIFTVDSVIYRQVNSIYKEHYDHFISSGLYKSLVDSNKLLSHEEISTDFALTNDAYKVLKPEIVPFISYPYEWCFSQLKDAALLTLSIQKIALEYDMILKDASAYNIQFVNGAPVFIDTISFEKYNEGQPWIAYKQFCQHFLAPLALMTYSDFRLKQLLQTNIDGIPLDLASTLLPFKSRFRISLMMHIHMHAKAQKRFADKAVKKQTSKMSKTALMGIIDSLESAVKRLHWKPGGTEWADYYDITNYSPDSFQIKKQVVAEFISMAKPKSVWDLGANLGTFSRIAGDTETPTVSFDIDPAAVEKNYLYSREKGEKYILPLLLDLTNPSSSIGWAHEERMSLLERAPADLVMGLALIHHLAISNNLPLEPIASFFGKIGKWLIIEFVPKSDSQVKKLLSTRDDIFPDYVIANFEKTFSKYFSINASKDIPGSERKLYLMKRKR